MAQVLDGKGLAAEIRAVLARRIESWVNAGGERPSLTLFRVGDDPASVVYVRNKEKASLEVGLQSDVVVLPDSTSESELLRRIDEANRDRRVSGILVQLPLPKGIRAEAVADAVDPEKDVDGLHPFNQGSLALGRPRIVACTPLGVLALLRRHSIPISGRRVVILGRSSIVGRPLSLLLSMKASWADATVTVAHSRSRGLDSILREAEIVIAAMGRVEALRGEQLSDGVVVVDVGMHRADDPTRPGKTRLLGDVHAPSVEPKASWLSPVPGGVGPLTVVMLLANTFAAHRAARGEATTQVWDDAEMISA